MALTGVVLVGFLVAHLSGNLAVFAGAEKYNAYAHLLTSTPILYVAEFFLLAFFLFHFATSVLLTGQNLAARPTGYTVKRGAGGASRRSFASATMILSGVLIFVFVPLHLWEFKYGPRYPSPGDPGVRDLHRLVLEIFQKPGYVIWYVLAMAVIGFHLWHGVGSMFESLGIAHRRWLRAICRIVAAVIALGFLVMPPLIYFVLRSSP